MSTENTEALYKIQTMNGGGLSRHGVHLVMIIILVLLRFRRTATSATLIATTIAVFDHFVSFPIQYLNPRNK